jgi:sodium/potassium-transporting ATPase subunit alpha
MKLPPRKPVTEASKARVKKIAAASANGTRTLLKRIAEHFTESSDEETLVDLDSLSWAYLEAGTIETIGCLCCFFFAIYSHYGITFSEVISHAAAWGEVDFTTADNLVITTNIQKHALALGQSGYFLALMIQQSFNLFICKARLSLPFGTFMFKNSKNFYGIICGSILSFGIVYIPYLNPIFGTSFELSPWVWVIAIGFGLLNFIYSIFRFLVKRLRTPLKYSSDVDGLDLHPTRFSTI